MLEEWACQIWGGTSLEGRESSLQVQDGQPCGRRSHCALCGLKEGLANIKAVQRQNGLLGKVVEIPILGGVQAGVRGRYGSQAFRFWHRTDPDLSCTLGVSGQRTSFLGASISLSVKWSHNTTNPLGY